MPCTNPTDGAAPVSDSSSATTRCAGMYCTTSRYTARACRFGPKAAGPDRAPPGRVAGAHRAAAAPHLMLLVLGDRHRDLGDLVAMVERTSPDRGALQIGVHSRSGPAGNRSTRSSGSSVQARYPPGALGACPRCVPILLAGFGWHGAGHPDIIPGLRHRRVGLCATTDAASRPSVPDAWRRPTRR